MDSEFGVDKNKKGWRAVVTGEKALQYASELKNFSHQKGFLMTLPGQAQLLLEFRRSCRNFKKIRKLFTTSFLLSNFVVFSIDVSVYFKVRL